MIYLICGSYAQAAMWTRKRLRTEMPRAVRDGKVVVLSTHSDRATSMLRGRTAQLGDRIERIGTYDHGKHWQPIEDTLKALGVES